MASARILLVASLLLITAALMAPSATARDVPNIGCGGDTVEVCTPVCVTSPCPAYVCVHVDEDTSVCRVLWT